MRKSREMQTIENYFVTLPSEKTANVVNTKLQYYVHEAIVYKRMFLSLSCFIAVMNASIPVINLLDLTFNKLLITIISSVSLVISGIFTLLSMKDTWYHFRSLAERLKRECTKFNSRVCPYSNPNPRINEILFILCFEEITSEEQNNWMMDGKKEQEAQSRIMDTLGIKKPANEEKTDQKEAKLNQKEEKKEEILKEACPYHQQVKK